MRYAIFGGTGHTGRHLVEQALDAGHEVTALSRDPGRFPAHPRLRAVAGDVARTNAETARLQAERYCARLTNEIGNTF